LAWLVTAVLFVVQRALDGGVRRTTAVIDERRTLSSG
jgi:hypothetical protein